MATRVPTTEITGVRGAMVKRFSKKMLGQVPVADHPTKLTLGLEHPGRGPTQAHLA